MEYGKCPQCKRVYALGQMQSHLQGKNCWGNSVPIEDEETERLYQYWKLKNNDCAVKHCHTHKQWKLSPTELTQLLNDAGITIYDVGRHSGSQYQLARHNDTGHYEVGNCRFITLRENMQERHTPGRSKRPVMVNGKRYATATEACRELGQGTVYRRLKSKDWPEWHHTE